jgi:nitrous oxide reductase accessory protein NosL
MFHTVEVGSFCGDLIAAMSNMMNWLSSRGSQPVISQQAAGNGTAFRLRFSTEAEALAFVCTFGGRLVR